MPYFNEELPREMTPSSIPRNAIVGRLNEDTTVEQMVARLAEHAIDDDRVHVLTGEGGIAFLEGAGSFLGRLLGGEERERAKDDLRGGATLVGIFKVPDGDEDEVGRAAAEAGITVTRHYGTWTYH